MEFSRELLFFFSALGAFNGFLLGIYFLFIAQPKHISNRFLGMLLIALSVRIGKSVFFFFNPDLAPIFLQIGITSCFFIGPFLYFYIKSMSEVATNWENEWKYHLALLIPIALFTNIFYPWEYNYDLWCTIIQIVYALWFFYWLATAVVLRKVIKALQKGGEKQKSFKIWIISIFIGNGFIWLAYNTSEYTSYIVGALSFSFLLYLLILLLVFNKNKDSILFRKQAKYGSSKIAETKAQKLIDQLTELMQKEKLYKNPNLKLAIVAENLNVLPHQISQIINANLNKTFSAYINEFRVEEAKRLLLSNESFSLEGIGYECGFNSKSTFYATFKKLTTVTPAQFKKNPL